MHDEKKKNETPSAMTGERRGVRASTRTTSATIDEYEYTQQQQSLFLLSCPNDCLQLDFLGTFFDVEFQLQESNCRSERPQTRDWTDKSGASTPTNNTPRGIPAEKADKGRYRFTAGAGAAAAVLVYS